MTVSISNETMNAKLAWSYEPSNVEKYTNHGFKESVLNERLGGFWSRVKNGLAGYLSPGPNPVRVTIHISIDK
jgi:hypothetical protein